jgi:hypothetical protein
MVFVKSDDRKPGGDLTTYLVFERVTELSGAMVLFVKRCVREAMCHHEFSRAFGPVMIKEEKPRIHETCEQMAAWFQYAIALSPHNIYIRHEYIGDRMENQIEGAGSERRQVRHIALYTSEHQVLAFRDVEVLA